MKKILIFIFILNTVVCFAQNPQTSRADSTKNSAGQNLVPIKFNGSLAGYITGYYVDKRGTYGPDPNCKEYKSSTTIYQITLLQPLTDKQTTSLEDSIKQFVLKKNRDTYISFVYTKDYYTISSNPTQVYSLDTTGAGYYLIKSGRLRNNILTFGIVASLADFCIINFVSPVAGVLIAGVCGIIILVEEYRANNMLKKAGEKMLLE